jgi:hypothetical protein
MWSKRRCSPFSTGAGSPNTLPERNPSLEGEGCEEELNILEASLVQKGFVFLGGENGKALFHISMPRCA